MSIILFTITYTALAYNPLKKFLSYSLQVNFLGEKFIIFLDSKILSNEKNTLIYCNHTIDG